MNIAQNALDTAAHTSDPWMKLFPDRASWHDCPHIVPLTLARARNGLHGIPAFAGAENGF